MGIDVSAQKVVTYNPAHQKRVITDPSRIPPSLVINSLKVVSVFGRRKVAQDNYDGNPLIYALKGKFGYTMPHGDFRQLLSCAQEIAPKALDGVQYDLVVPLPSTSLVTNILAKRVSRLNGGCSTVECLDKVNIGQVLATAPNVNQVANRYRTEFRSQLHSMQVANPNDFFEMKHVPIALRSYFIPVIANHIAGQIANKKILLVDDILGSGTSLLSAARGLKQFGPSAIVGFTLMGRLA
ncbi:MAG: phosphoribosyltransferase [Sphingorhabdus sp.]|uniref:phosphoribosyltransferase n=1 Tax=Sphingorhabdus sp. TaxID=1902408 RepID=UPI0038FCF948